MKNYTILPADTYMVVNRTVLDDRDKKILSLLYQPIIGYTAVSLYLTLLGDLDELQVMSTELTHHHLMATMQLRLDDIILAREKLEACGLLKTYIKEGNVNDLVYLLYSPLSAHEFFNHPILNIVLYNNLGKKEYNRIIDCFKIPHINLKSYTDITMSFSEVFKAVNGNLFEQNLDVMKRTTNTLALPSIDFNLLISGIPTNMLNEKCFTPEIKELINNLSFIYNLDTTAMLNIIRDAINEKGLIDKTELRKIARNYYQFETGTLPTLIYNRQPEYLKKPTGDNSKWAQLVYTFENITPYQLLKAKYNGAEPTDHDKRIIESLLIDQKLNAGVVNVLISYVLKTNNQQLKKSYVETIAGQWKRLKIETVEEAMHITEKEHHKLRRLVSKDKPLKDDTKLPIWFNKENTPVEISSQDSAELTKLLNELV